MMMTCLSFVSMVRVFNSNALLLSVWRDLLLWNICLWTNGTSAGYWSLHGPLTDLRHTVWYLYHGWCQISVYWTRL